MNCISPIYLKQRHQSVPCGKCNFCLSNKRADWSFRLRQELKKSSSGFFVTLTYADPYLVYDVQSQQPALEVTHLQKFIKRLRKYDSKFKGSSPIKYYAVGEYGPETERPHYHLIVYNMRLQTANYLPSLWREGNVMLGLAEPASIHYTAKYCITRHDHRGTKQKPFSLSSKGLGKNYLINAKAHKDSDRQYIRNADGIQRIPRYLKDKIWPTFKIEVVALTEWYLKPVTVRIPINVGLREKLSRDQKEKAEAIEAKEIERLRDLHPDPLGYLNEQKRHAHEMMTRKLSKSKNPI